MAKKKKVQYRDPRTCIFCAGPRDSREHVAPDWMKPLLHGYNGTIHWIAEGNKPPLAGALNKPGDHRGRRIRCVCVPCNTGWMSRLQSVARQDIEPLVRGQSVYLSAARRRRIASWATMFCMVYEQADDVDTQTTTQALRQSFKANQTPPPDWFFWIGHHRDPQHPKRFTVNRRSWATNAGPAGEPRCQMTVALIAGMVICAMYVPPSFQESPTLLPAVRRCAASFRLQEVWPEPAWQLPSAIGSALHWLRTRRRNERYFTGSDFRKVFAEMGECISFA